MDSRNESNRIRVVMLPWLAYSHISSFLELAKRLTTNDHFHVYLSSTPVNLDYIKNNLSKKHSQSIDLVEFNLPSSPEFPPHYHTTNGLPVHLNETLVATLEKSSQVFTTILQNLHPDLLIYDFNQSWAAHVASTYNIPSVMFSTGGAAAWSAVLHPVSKHSSRRYPFLEINPKAHDELTYGFEYFKAFHSFLDSMNMSHDIILINSTRELEGKYIDYLSQILEKKVLPVGALIQEPLKEDDIEYINILRWLNKKKESSVVFISLGSECYLSANEIQDIGYGLELSEVSFIWVIRFPHGSKTRVEQVLPYGFLDRLGERGMVIDKWAPQAKILSHSSTGGFVSHCGWCSIMESIFYGVPIIAMPMQYDQPYNARLVEAIGVGIVVDRGGDGRLKREDMAKVVRTVVVEDGGRSIREKVAKLSKIMRSRVDEEVDRVVMENLVKITELKN